MGIIKNHVASNEVLSAPVEEENFQKQLEDELEDYPELQSLMNEEADDTDSDLKPDPLDDMREPAYTELPEKILIWLPHRDHSAPAITHDYELKLQSAHALEQTSIIRSSIGDKSLLIQILIRRNRNAGQWKKGKTWAAVNKAHSQLFEAWATYERARVAIQKLPSNAATEAWNRKLLPIKKEQLQDVEDVTKANRYGQKLDTLPWFWNMQDKERDKTILMKESE